jgi:hypothetical protein
MMDEYIKLKIKNHPSISSENVNFLTAHATYKELQRSARTYEEGRR